VPKSLSARIVVNLHPRTLLGLVGLLQRQGDVAKWTPAARIEQICFGGFKRISPNFHRIGIRVFYTSRSPAYCALAQGVPGPMFALTFRKQCYTFRNLSSGYAIRPSSPCFALHTIIDVFGNNRPQHHGGVALGIDAGGSRSLSSSDRRRIVRFLATGYAAAGFLFELIDGAGAQGRRSYGWWKVLRQRLRVSTR
jgi:hypothetical protein